MNLRDFNIKSPLAWGRGVLFFVVVSVLIGVALIVVGWIRGRVPALGRVFWTPEGAWQPVVPQQDVAGPVYRTYGV